MRNFTETRSYCLRPNASFLPALNRLTIGMLAAVTVVLCCDGCPGCVTDLWDFRFAWLRPSSRSLANFDKQGLTSLISQNIDGGSYLIPTDVRIKILYSVCREIPHPCFPRVLGSEICIKGFDLWPPCRTSSGMWYRCGLSVFVFSRNNCRLWQFGHHFSNDGKMISICPIVLVRVPWVHPQSKYVRKYTWLYRFQAQTVHFGPFEVFGPQRVWVRMWSFP